MHHVSETLSCGTVLSFPAQVAEFAYINTLAIGTFSLVTAVLNKADNQKYACKVMSKDLLNEYDMLTQIEQELRIMETISHPNIVKTRKILYTDELILVIMDLYEKGDLFSRIEDHGPLPHLELQRIFGQIVSAVSFLHSKNIVHLDIKPENVFLDESFNAYLGDFSLSRFLAHENQKIRSKCGTLYYIAPEVVADVSYDGKKSDIWSLGIVLFAMATGMVPWNCISEDSIEDQILDASFEIPANISPAVASLMLQILRYKPEERPTASSLLQMPFLYKTNACIRLSRPISYLHGNRSRKLVSSL